jgi:hypothetical protein
VQSSIKLNNQNNKNESLDSINEIAVIMSSSNVYNYSIIVIFEPKYVIINDLGFDVVY